MTETGKMPAGVRKTLDKFECEATFHQRFALAAGLLAGALAIWLFAIVSRLVVQ